MASYIISTFVIVPLSIFNWCMAKELSIIHRKMGHDISHQNLFILYSVVDMFLLYLIKCK